MDVDDITNFLPKYPNIEPRDPIFNLYPDTNFNESIYKKKEFYDDKLPKIEEFPQKAGVLMKHQKIISKFFSSFTLYNSLLLVHEPGTGKSCAAIGAVEKIKEDGSFRGVLYIAKGEALLNNFIHELIHKCTDGRYIPENYPELTRIEKIRREKKAIGNYYSFNTYEVFAKKIKSNSNELLRKQYNNYIIILDEVHNLRIQEKHEGLNIYDQFNRFLHTVENCKILFLSGTPMKDGVDEIASIMNLLLPLQDKKISQNDSVNWDPNKTNFLPTGERFEQEFFTKKDNIFTVKDSKKKELKNIFKGKVSYLRSMQSNIKKVFEGKLVGTLRYLKVVPDIMSPFQTKHYLEAYQLDQTAVGQIGFSSNSRQASLFVFPDGSFGKKGFETYVISRKKDKGPVLVGTGGEKIRLMNFSLKTKLTTEFKGDNNQKLQTLQQYSTVYAAGVKNILEAHAQGKCVFIYNEFVEGGGLILFGLILELFGFKRASGGEALNDYAPRYISLTNITSSPKQINNLVKRFNQPDNVFGQVITVIIGSKTIIEGFSFQNIQIEEIQTPWFNYSVITQALARGSRLGSHNELLKAGAKDLSLRIYQRVAIPINEQGKSIDLKIYQMAENKDISIKGVERLIKEASFDCALNYDRNFIPTAEGQRDCDYMQCAYTCDGIPPELLHQELTGTQLDYSTYQIYYSQATIQKIIQEIAVLFQTRFFINLSALRIYLNKYTDFDILTSLRKIINENIPVKNKYGLISYIKEDRNIFFLISSLSIKGGLFSSYYTEFPTVKPILNFKSILSQLYTQELPNIIKKVCNSSSVEELRQNIIELPINLHEEFLESSILAKEQGIIINKPLIDLILKYFEYSYKKINGIWVSWLLLDTTDVIRYLNNGIWEDSGQEYTKQILTLLQQQKLELEQNPYGYYGLYNSNTEKFCIRNVSSPIPKKKTEQTTGKLCSSYHLEKELYPLVINILDPPLPDDKVLHKYFRALKASKKGTINIPTNLNDRDTLWDIISGGKIKIINKLFTDKDKYTAKAMLKIIYFGSMQKKQLCQHIQEFFEQKGFLKNDPECGRHSSIIK